MSGEPARTSYRVKLSVLLEAGGEAWDSEGPYLDMRAAAHDTGSPVQPLRGVRSPAEAVRCGAHRAGEARKPGGKGLRRTGRRSDRCCKERRRKGQALGEEGSAEGSGRSGAKPKVRNQDLSTCVPPSAAATHAAHFTCAPWSQAGKRSSWLALISRATKGP